MSQLENQLGSWQLRQPSPSIKRGLYPTASAREAASLSLRWLGPVAACLLLAAISLFTDFRYVRRYRGICDSVQQMQVNQKQP